MSEDVQESAPTVLESRSRALFHDSVEALDMPMRSRLTQARHAALEAAGRRSWFSRALPWSPAAGVTAAALLGVALWFGNLTGSSLGHLGVSPPGMTAADSQPNLEDLDIVASSDGSGDAMDMLQDDLDFYDFADKAANPGPAA